MKLLATAGVLVMVSATAWAQQPAAGGRGNQPQQPPTDITKATVMTDAELHAAIAKVGNDRPQAAVRVFQLPGNMPYTVNVEHRTNQPQAASVHETEAELFYVIDGSATMVTGGKLVGETRNGSNLSGKSIEGGTPNKLAKGDFLMVPEGVPHWFSQIDANGLNIMSFHLVRATLIEHLK
jgi:mannose-6-phosphate isomerase-like protein (cupin superfamily)